MPSMNGRRLIRNSERATYKRCRQQWQWNFVDLLKPVEEARALRFGDLVHQSLARYYKPGTKRGPHPARTFLKLYKHEIEVLEKERLNMRDEEKWLDAEELGQAMLEGYVERYHEHDKQFRVLSSEQTFQVPIKTIDPITFKPVRFVVVGTLDGVWQNLSDDEIFFKEFKTATSIDLSPLPMDEQAGTYWTYAPKWLWRQEILPQGVYPNHILYTFLRKSMPDERPENQLGQKLNKPTRNEVLAFYEAQGKVPKAKGVEELIAALPGAEACGAVSKKQPSPYFARQPVYRDHADRVNMHKRVCDEALEMERVRRGELAVIKNPGPLYNQNCKSCAFRDMCELHETGADWEAMRDATMTTWDPYDAHEIVERW